jgi:ABC-2 type transport system ATP-binding protein
MATCDERSFYWRLTSRQNLTFFAKLCGLSKRAARQRVNVLLDLLDLMPVADRSYRVLSTGNRQRLAIARALLLDPDLLLLDEPTNSLDPIAAARLREVIQDRIAADGKRAVVITSHNLEEVQDLSSRVAILSHGRILETDHLPALRARYASEETVRIEVRGSIPSLLLDQLKPLAVSVESRHKNDGCSELFFRQDPGSSTTHQILTLLVEAGIEVIRCHAEGSSLKDVFDRLVGGESPDA